MSALSPRRFLADYALLFPLLILCGYIVAESYQVDFRAFYVAGKSILLGLDPYLNPVGQHPELYVALNAEAEPFSAFRYPPLAAWCFVPLALMPYTVARFVFAVITFAMVLAVGWWVFRGRPTTDATRLALTLAVVSLPVQATFQRGQVDLILVLLALAAFSRWQRSPRDLWAPLLLALGTVFKVFPGVLALYFLCRKQWRFLGTYLVSTLALFWLPLPWLGLEAYRNFARRSLPELFGPIQAGAPIHLLGQKTVFFGSANYVDAFEGRGMVASRDFVGGGMNPLLFDHTLLAIALGSLALVLVYRLLRGQTEAYRYLAMLNLVNLVNPLSWLMGVVWYLPWFLSCFPQASSRQRLLLLAPLFFPPALGLNGYLAIAIPLLPAVRSLGNGQVGE